MLALAGWLKLLLLSRLDLTGAASPNNLQLRYSQLIQQINCLLEPFILHKGSISFLSCLHRGMAKQMLNVSDSSTVGSNHLDRLSAFLRFMVW